MRANYKGKGDKNILIISGVHGDEKTPLAVTTKIINSIKEFPQNFNELIVMHGVNRPALIADSRFDGDFDLNRAFDGNHDDHPLVVKLKKEIENADIIIDIHSSKSCMELIAIDANQYAESFCVFAHKINIPYLIHEGSEGTIKRYCLSIDKPCFTVEVNRLGEVDNHSALMGYEMVCNMVENIDDLEFYPSYNVPPLTKCFTTKPNCVILPLVNAGDIIQPNQKVGIKIMNGGEIKYIISKEEKPCNVLSANYVDYENDENILRCNTQENITLFSISS